VLEIPVWFDTLVCQLLEKKPEQRPRDAAMVAQALEQVQEKVATLKSAGVDAAQRRRVDPSTGRGPSDETDRQAARMILTGLGKMKVRRQKKKGGPPVERKWLQAVGIVLLLGAIGGFVYWQTRPPSADKLYEHAKKLMTSDSPEDWEKGRDGPVEEYLHRYPTRTDEQAREVQSWADKVDLLRSEQQMLNRRKWNITPDNEAEANVRRALDREDAGDLAEARRFWQEVRTRKDESRVWGLLGDKRVHDLDEVAGRERQLRDRVQAVRRLGAGQLPEKDPERQAAWALYYEEFGDQPAAFDLWKLIKEHQRKDGAERPWHLLAAQKCRELEKDLPASPEDRKVQRTELISGKLTQAEQGREPRMVYNDIVTLYGNENDYPELKELVAKAREGLQQPGS
jgi:hypothetical protein